MSYKVIQVKWNTDHERYIAEIYRLLKDQENKIFDLTFTKGIEITDDLIMDYIEDNIKHNYIFVITDDAEYICCFFMLEGLREVENIIVSANLHCAVSKRYWGKKSRELGQCMLDYLKDNLKPLKRLVAFVPQHNFGVVKLLKDLQFKHEGTLRNNLVFNNKYGVRKFYDELIYSLIREDIKYE